VQRTRAQGPRELRAQPVQRVRQPPRHTTASRAARSRHVFETASVPPVEGRDLRLAAFTSATGSAGTIAAGDRLKDDYGTKIVAVEALECPTMLENGFGEHNIQGIGDKHIPLIHNVMNTDVVAAISDRRHRRARRAVQHRRRPQYLVQSKGVPAEVVDTLEHFGFSAICNVLAAIKTAKLLDLGPDDAIITVATDGAALYPSERAKTLSSRYGNEFTTTDAAEVFGEHLGSVGVDNMIDCTEPTVAASSTSATTPGSSSRARRSSCSRSAATRSSGGACAATSTSGTR
jgi:cysteine synthase